MYYLKKILSGLGDFVGSIFESIVPDSVKTKLEKLGAGISAGDFKTMFMAIFQLIFHWYFLMVTVSIIVLSRLIAGLKKAGVLDKFEEIVTKALSSVLYISENCFQEMDNIKKFFNCIQGSP